MRLLPLLTSACLLLAVPASAQDALHARVIDVGAGLCVVVKVTTGGDDSFMIYDAGWGAERTAAAIREFIPPGEPVELLVLSHTDSDHFSAVPQILATYPVLRVLHTGLDRDNLPGDEEPDTITNGLAAIETAAAQGMTEDLNLTRVSVGPGDSFPIGNAAAVLVSGFGEMPPGWGLTDASKIRNSVSIVVRLDFAGRSVLLCGDAVGRRDGDPAAAPCIAAEAFMVGGAERLDSDVLLAAHHGADNASCMDFIRAVSPEWVVFSAGSKHRHPRHVTAERFLAATDSGGSPLLDSAHLLRTDLGDNEGGTEWSFGTTAAGDATGDDDVEITISAAGDLAVHYRSQGTPVEDGGTPATTSVVRIVSMIPDPVGSDAQLEEVTIESAESHDLAGWRLRDPSGDSWALTGAIGPGEQRTFLRNGRSMSLNNNGDTISLVDADGQVVDQFFYESADEGEVLTGGGQPAQAADLRIFSLVPDPDGRDRDEERVSIRNGGGSAMPLAGWVLRDADGKTWALDGTVAAGQTLEVRRAGRSMDLNNGGDTVELVSPTAGVIDSVTYGPVTEGRVLLAEDLR